MKTALVQLPFFLIFCALFGWLYFLASENMELSGQIISTLLGGSGMTFIFADVDLYKRILKKQKQPQATDSTLTDRETE